MGAGFIIWKLHQDMIAEPRYRRVKNNQLLKLEREKK